VIHKRKDETIYDMEVPLQKAYINGNKLEFENSNSLEMALTDGIFMLRIPRKLNLSQADLFANSFYKSPSEAEFGKYSIITSDSFNDPLLGFHKRIDQIEQFLLERRFWNEWYPKTITATGEELCKISQVILNAVLDCVGLDSKDYKLATGGCSDVEGSYHLTFNHFRPSMTEIGLSSH